jgi:arylsulfatase A-like enzyme
VSLGGRVDLSDKIPVLPELLQKAGYTTCAVDNLYDTKWWFARGYEFYINPSFRHPTNLLVTCEEINARAIPWLKTHADERFFMFLHYWDPHTPYIPPRRYRRLFYNGDPCDPAHRSLEPLSHQPLGDFWRETWFPKVGGSITDAEYIISLYNGEIRYVDEGIGTLLAALEDAGLGEETVVIITADHGESLTEHNIFFDHHGLYDCTLRAPLIIRWPGGEIPNGRRITCMVKNLDLAPTLLEVAGAPIPKEMDGVSLLPLLQGAPDISDNGILIAEECTWQAKWAIRADGYKFILAREPDLHNTPMQELYSLKEDPGELHNLAEEQPEVAREFERRLEEWIAEQMARHGLTEDPLRAQGITLGKRWKEQGNL